MTVQTRFPTNTLFVSCRRPGNKAARPFDQGLPFLKFNLLSMVLTIVSSLNRKLL